MYSYLHEMSFSVGNQRILCLLFNSAQFHHYETAMTPLSEMCDWAFSSALGHTLCKASLCFSHHQYVWFGNKTRWCGKHACAFFCMSVSPFGLMISLSIKTYVMASVNIKNPMFRLKDLNFCRLPGDIWINCQSLHSSACACLSFSSINPWLCISGQFPHKKKRKKNDHSSLLVLLQIYLLHRRPPPSCHCLTHLPLLFINAGWWKKLI